MHARSITWFVLLSIALLLATAAYFMRNTWMASLPGTIIDTPSERPHAPAAKERVKLSRQAQANLRLVVKPLQLQSYRRTIQVPGVVVERRGKGDQSIVAPFAGVIKEIHAIPGDVVQPGGAVLTLRLNSEPLQTSQTELFKTAQEIKITEDQKRRLDAAAKQGAIPEVRLLELQYQLERLGASRKAYRADLGLKGLTPEMIDGVEKGEFLKETVVRVPSVIEGFQPSQIPANGEAKAANTRTPTPLLEIEELKVFPGEQVQAGQLLGHLANHQNLYIEGRGFREDTALVEKTAAAGWPLQVRFSEEREGHWPPLEKPLTILYLANNIDPVSQTFPFFVPLPNQYREYNQAGKTYRIWRFRPGQRVQLRVPVGELPDVFVLPTAALAREGAETYVFRQNGDYFDRKPVYVIHEDALMVVLVNDGSVFPGDFIAQNAAEALNRALKAQESQAGSQGHDHGHSH
ncbi:MAG: MchE protein [Planctomycetes bacterium]|nr:MchE protein [Planctomycetota bacterium]